MTGTGFAPAARKWAGLFSRDWLPQGRALSGQDAAWRHRIVLTLLALLLPVLLLVGALGRRSPLDTALSVLPPAVLLAVAAGPLRRRARSVAVFVVLGQLLGGVLADPAPAHGLLWRIAVHGGVVLAESAVLVMFWRADERARAGEERLQAALWQGQSSVQARLEQTERIRTDLIGTVSHEFRTPLTGIRGAALTLLKRGDRLDEAGRQRLLEGVLHQQERLSRLLENMLTAARATAADPSAVAEVHAVAAEVSMLAGAAGTGRPAVALVVEPGLSARIDRQALHQVLANLIDNAHQHGTPGAVPLLAAGQDGDEVWLAVSNEGGLRDARAADLLFEPFTQGEGGPTRCQEGLGMGLYVVRRLVEVYGGRLTVRAEQGWVTVEVRLPSAREGVAGPAAQMPAPTALPTR